MVLANRKRFRLICMCTLTSTAFGLYTIIVQESSPPPPPRYSPPLGFEISDVEMSTSTSRRFNCAAIVEGDEVAVAAAAELVAKTAKSRGHHGLGEAELLAMTRDCDAFRRVRRYVTVPLSREEETFPIAYSVVAHHRVDMLERLLRAVYAPQNLYCLHVDAKSPRAYLEAARAIAACFPNVFVAARLEKVVYASWSRVQADLNCMSELVAMAERVPWRYFINLCGRDFPIKTNLEMVRALRTLNGRNSLETVRMPRGKRARWTLSYKVAGNEIHSTGLTKRPPPISTPMFAGSAYVVVTRAFVEHVLSDPAARALIEWAGDTYSPDEHLWATLQRMPGVPGSTPAHRIHDVTDAAALARLVKWSAFEGDVAGGGAAYPPCRGTHVRDVCVYGAGDLAWMLRQHHLFANKVDTAVDHVAVHCLEHHLRKKAMAEAAIVIGI